MVEAEDVTGVSFTPELWMQRRAWALDVLRREGVRSVLDIGCGPGALLETLVIPPSTIREPPIRPPAPPKQHDGQPPSPIDSDLEEQYDEAPELFLSRLAGLDNAPGVIQNALKIITPPTASSSFPPPTPRWEPLNVELWLGNMERYNSRLEGYEAIVALEVIEHLDPNILSRFGVVTMGTYRPRILLVTTPNFDFNSKFPRKPHSDFAQKGFIDPTGRTERVFRHSDHKLEMTSAEFREWAEGAAADWGYSVEISGVGISSIPSYYEPQDPSASRRPIYATQTAIFRLASGVPARSPRSVRTTELPFMPGSKESSHPHKLAGKYEHPRAFPGDGRRQPPDAVREVVRRRFASWQVGQVTLSELWGSPEVCAVCAGSKRWLVAALGGWGDVGPGPEASGRGGEFAVSSERGRGLTVRWNGFQPASDEPAVAEAAAAAPGPGRPATGGADTGGW